MVKNLDRTFKIENKEEQIESLKAAFEGADAAEVAKKILDNYENNASHFEKIMNETIAEAQRAHDEKWDSEVLKARGVRVLTSEEKKFYNAAIEVESFDGVAQLMPPTVYERVFEDLTTEHPLISAVNAQRTGATTKWVVRRPGTTTAFWGDVCDTIKEMADEGFATIDQGMQKLSGFLVVCKAMFEIGPEWLDRYVRTFLAEVIADELENAIVNGDGNKMPIGMIRDLEGAVTGGVYPEKTPIVLEKFDPQTIGTEILAPTTEVNGVAGRRRFTGVTLIVNPFDYAAKFFAAGVKQKDDGSYTFNNFAIPGLTIIQSPAVPLNRMITGVPKDYFFGYATEAKIESTDVLRMIEDQRLYLVRQLANGKPIDNKAFRVFDITDTQFVKPDPEVTPTP